MESRGCSQCDHLIFHLWAAGKGHGTSHSLPWRQDHWKVIITIHLHKNTGPPARHHPLWSFLSHPSLPWLCIGVNSNLRIWRHNKIILMDEVPCVAILTSASVMPKNPGESTPLIPAFGRLRPGQGNPLAKECNRFYQSYHTYSYPKSPLGSYLSRQDLMRMQIATSIC
jgi:hypothetical protein